MTPIRDRDRNFLGVGWAFPPKFSRALGVHMAAGVEDIHESLRILLSTDRGERVMVPAYGCDLRPRVFRDLTTGLVTEIKDLVEQAIVLWEPRIEVLAIQVRSDDTMQGRILVDVAFEVRRTNVRSNLVFPFSLREATLAPPEG